MDRTPHTLPGNWICIRCLARAITVLGIRVQTRRHPVELPCATCGTATDKTVAHPK